MIGLIFLKCPGRRGGKKNDQYTVKQLKYRDFLDLKKLSGDILANKTKNIQGDRVNWLKIKCFRIEKDYPNIIKYKYKHSEEYLSFDVRKRGQAARIPTLIPIYAAMLPISEAKYKDLNKLCTTHVIPEEFHGWYASLPASRTVRDRNVEASVDSESGED